MVKLIFIGDSHGFLNDFKKQKEIIEKYTPEFVLAEQLQEISLVDKETYSRAYADSRFKDQKQLINLCKKHGIKLIGMDLKNFGFNKKLQSIVNGNLKPTKKDLQKIKEIVNKRSKHHISIIKAYLRKTNKPVVIIIGSWHLRNNSLLRYSFSDYLAICPVDKNGKIITSPRQIKQLKYAKRQNRSTCNK